MVRGDLAGGVHATCCLEGRLRHGRSCRRGRRRSQGCVPEWRSRRWSPRLGEADRLAPRWRSRWGRLTCCFGQLGMAIRPGNARALVGPWGQMRRGGLAGSVQVTCCLEGWLRHGRSCRRGRRRSQGCVPERLSARCTSRLGEAGLLSSRRRSDWCVPERSSQGWTHNGAPWKREARTIGATSRPGAQMPISAWDHRFHGEGERQ